MTIEALIRAVPPPAAPSEAYYGPWGPIEARIGRELPPDYKDFIRLYGGGYFMQAVMIYVAGATTWGARLESHVPLICRTFTTLGDDQLPYRLWPEADGLIPFGATDCGDYIFWLAEGEASSWKVVVWGRGLGSFEVFDCDATDFLAGLASDQIMPKEFPELSFDRLFEPFPPVPDWRRPMPFGGSAETSLRLSWRLGHAGSGPSGISPTRARDAK